MTLLQDFSILTNSKEFKEFKQENPDSILTSIFLNDKYWEFNYLFKNKIMIFSIKNKEIDLEESEIYENSKPEELEINKINIQFEKAKELAKKMMNDEKVTKEIIILQQKEIPFWNISFITMNMNVFNIKLNAISGEIIEQKFENIMNFKSVQ